MQISIISSSDKCFRFSIFPRVFPTSMSRENSMEKGVMEKSPCTRKESALPRMTQQEQISCEVSPLSPPRDDHFNHLFAWSLVLAETLWSHHSHRIWLWSCSTNRINRPLYSQQEYSQHFNELRRLFGRQAEAVLSGSSDIFRCFRENRHRRSNWHRSGLYSSIGLESLISYHLHPISRHTRKVVGLPVIAKESCPPYIRNV